MAKRPRITRKVGKDNQVYYSELKKDKNGIEKYTRIDSKRGAKYYVEKNYDKLKHDSTSLTDIEKEVLNRSKGQRELYRWDGKPIRKSVTDFLKKEKIISNKTPKELSKSNLDALKRPSDVERIYKELATSIDKGEASSTYGNSGYRDRQRIENLVSLREEVNPLLEQGYTFNVVDEEGNEYNDKQGWNAIRKYESNVYKSFFDDKRVAFIRFPYKLIVDKVSKIVSIFLTDVQPEVGESDPNKRTEIKNKNKKTKKK